MHMWHASSLVMTLELVCCHWKYWLCKIIIQSIFLSAPALLTSQFGSGDGPVVYSYVNCMGFEKSLVFVL